MKLINSSYEILDQEMLKGSPIVKAKKQIEKIGRVCYKSESRITKSSYEAFYDNMVKSGHLAMLEHGAVYLKIPMLTVNVAMAESAFDRLFDACKKYGKIDVDSDNYYFSTNMRVIIEHNLEDLLVKYSVDPCEYHEKRYSVKFICDRGVSHEFVRHRVFSFAQESTRFCNYSKKKFNNEITYVKPEWLYSASNAEKQIFVSSLELSEQTYFNILALNHTPQEARAVLPTALKTELVMTGFAEDWKHFFDLRAFGVTGLPHPDAKRLAMPLANDFIKRGLLKDFKAKE